MKKPVVVMLVAVALVFAAGLGAVLVVIVRDQIRTVALLKAEAHQRAEIQTLTALPDATIVMAPYVAERDYRAAVECRENYHFLALAERRGNLLQSERREREVKREIAERRFVALTGFPEPRRQSLIIYAAFRERHDYCCGRLKEGLARGLEAPTLRETVCDAALDAWGAPKVDETAIRQEMQANWAKQDERAARAAAAKTTKPG